MEMALTRPASFAALPKSAALLVAVVNLGAASTRSVANALRKAGAIPFLLDRREQLRRASALVIPGVANLGYMIDRLDLRKLRDPILDTIASGLPTLGICAGFQLLFTGSEEAPLRRGLGVIDGMVARLPSEKVPHMGWNHIVSLTPQLEDGWAYFAHSFAVPASCLETVGITENGVSFASAVRKDNVWGVQFHPERSGHYGKGFLERFVRGISEGYAVGG